LTAKEIFEGLLLKILSMNQEFLLILKLIKR